jgi:hypothetical protein
MVLGLWISLAPDTKKRGMIKIQTILTYPKKKPIKSVPQQIYYNSQKENIP